MGIWQFVVIFIPGLLSLIVGKALAAEQKDSLFSYINSPGIELMSVPIEDPLVINPPWWMKILQEDFIRIDPAGDKEPVGEACSTEHLQLSPTQGPLEVQKYFSKCESSLRTEYSNIFTNIYRTVFLELHPTSHPMAKHVMLHLPGGVNVKGLLGLKPGGVKRPLVILRLGIFSNTVQFFPERYLFMQLFEQSPFNILVLESTSGSEFSIHNDHFFLGGYDEGLQNYYIARMLQDPREPISNLIDSVHLVGVSLGGHGTFFAALLNELNTPAISSFIGICPLVNFNETFEFHSSSSWKMRILNFWANLTDAPLKRLFPDLKKTSFIQDILDHLKTAENSYDMNAWQVRMPPGFENMSFMERLNFWDHWKDIRTPFLVFATEEDPVVPYALNTGKLVDHSMDVGSSNLAVVTLPQGYHCSIPAAYNWHGFTEVFKKYISTNSKAWTPQIQGMQSGMELAGRPFDVQVGDFDAKITVIDGLANRFAIIPGTVMKNALGIKGPYSPEAKSMITRWLRQNLSSKHKDQAKFKETDLFWEY